MPGPKRKTKLAADTIGEKEVGFEPSVVSPSTAVLQQMGVELGLTGTANWAGHLYTETNRRLQHILAYGVPGGRFGFWENLERTNGYVTAALESVAAPVRDAVVEIEPADEKLVPDAQKHADFVKWNLLEALEPRWPTFLDQLVKRPLNYGFGLWEPVLERLEGHPMLPNGSGFKLKKLAERLPVSIDVNGWREKDGELDFVKQRGPKNGKWVYVDLPAADVLLHTWGRTGNNYAGWSVFRPVEYACRIMDHLLRLTGVSMVREGAGVPYAEAMSDKTRKLTDKARARLWKQLANMVYHENAAIVMPRGWTLKWFVSAGRDKSSVIKAYHDLGKLILFQTKSQEIALGLNETGSRSVGEVHAKGNEEFVQGVVAEAEATLNGVGARKYTGLPRRIIDPNFGPQKAYPSIRLVPRKASLEPKDRADAIAVYVGAGMITPTTDDENAAREDVGLPPIDDATRDAAIAKQVAVKQASAPPMPPAPPKPGATAPPGAPRPPPAPPAPPPPPPGKQPGTRASRRVRLSFQPSRPLRESEKHVDFAAIDNFLNSAREHFETQAKPLVAAMVVRALPAVRKAMEAGKPSDVGELALDTTELAGFVKRFLTESRAEGYRQVHAEYTKGTAGKVAKERAEGDQKHAPVVRFAEGEEEGKEDDTSATDADEQLDAMQTHLVRRMRQRATSDLERAAIDEDRTAGDADDVVRSVVSDLLDTGALKSDAGLVLTKAFNVGREQFAQEHGDEVESVELSALLDGNQCDTCENLDGEEYDFDSPEHLEHIPPLKECEGGDRCRCMLMYNFKKGDAGADEEGDEGAD